jgi:hypothetical protein
LWSKFLTENSYLNQVQSNKIQNTNKSLKIWRKIYFRNPLLSTTVVLCFLSENNLPKFFNLKKFPIQFEEKIRKLKMFQFESLYKEIYNQKDYLKNDIVISTMLFDSVKIILFLFSYEITLLSQTLTSKFKENSSNFETKFVKLLLMKITTLLLEIYKLKTINKQAYKIHLREDVNKLFHSIILNHNECINFIILNVILV